MPQLPQLIIFDMAGTTLRDDRFVHETLAKAMHTLDIWPDDEALNEVMGLPKPVAIAQLLSWAGHGVNDSLVLQLHGIFLNLMIQFYRDDPRVEEIPGTSALFERLRGAGIRIATDTGFSRDIADIIIDRLGWRELLDDHICSDEVQRGRPFPDMGLLLMNRLGIASAPSVLKVGDTASDIQMGRALGCGWVVGVCSGSLRREELAIEHPTHIIESVADLESVWV